jgi:hypothetical protein
MQSVNSLSGGKTSSYMAVHYPADFELFSLVRTSDPACKFKDDKLRQMVSDKIGKEFIGTLEEDAIVYTMMDLEQFIGREINWISGPVFDDIIKRKNRNGEPYTWLPNKTQRFCTVEMKILPIFNWCRENTNLPVEMRIGFRANEINRAISMIDKCVDGIEKQKAIVGKRKDGKNKWQLIDYRKPKFPLIEDNILRDSVLNFWKDKPVRFAYMNNCVGCFHRNPALLKLMSEIQSNKFEWFSNQETEKARFITGTTYDRIKNSFKQVELFESDFNECDSGFCGL